jgi:predicted transcriptional regulator
MKILLSIKPEHAEKIMTGEKKYEYRKSIFKNEVQKIVIYVTKPVGKIIGEFTLTKIIKGSPDEVWKRTHNHSGVSKEFFMNYFENRETSYALRITDFKKFEEDIDPKTVFTDFTAPQSYMYLEESKF